MCVLVYKVAIQYIVIHIHMQSMYIVIQVINNIDYMLCFITCYDHYKYIALIIKYTQQNGNMRVK